LRRPPEFGFSAFPTEALPDFPAFREVGDGNRVEYITAFSERKQLLASIIFCRRRFFAKLSLNLFVPAPQTRIDEKFCFE
jgi:hypothetical protein